MPHAKHTLYVSAHGNNDWDGHSPEHDGESSHGPLATIQEAVRRVREYRNRGWLTGTATIRVGKGVYRIDRPIALDSRDSLLEIVAQEGALSEFSGAVELTGWSEQTRNGQRVFLRSVAQHLRQYGVFRSFFVHGERRPRPRWPKEGLLRMKDVPGRRVDEVILHFGTDAFVPHEGDIPPLAQPSVVDVCIPHMWVEERIPIERVENDCQRVILRGRTRFIMTDGWSGKWACYYLDNVREGFTEPGQWYLDEEAGEVLYLPRVGESVDSFVADVPIVSQLLRITGNPESREWVDGIRIQGITFWGSDWQMPAPETFWWDPQMHPLHWKRRYPNPHEDRPPTHLRDCPTGMQAAFNVSGSVFLRGVRGSSIEGCTVRGVGLHAIALLEGCSGNRVEGCHLHDLGGGGVLLDGSGPEGEPECRTMRNVVRENLIESTGWVFPGACGICSVHGGEHTFEFNSIRDTTYSGISVGWTWGFGPTVSHENQILQNNIHNIGSRGYLSDLAGIYLLGRSPGTLVRGNRIRDVRTATYGGWGIYADWGASFLLIEHNCISNTQSESIHEHFARQNTYRFNLCLFGGDAGILCNGESSQLWASYPAQGLVFERNVVVTKAKPMFNSGFNFLAQTQPLSDQNLFWDVDRRNELVLWQRTMSNVQGDLSLDETRAAGREIHSLVRDPGILLGIDGHVTIEQDVVSELGFRELPWRSAGARLEREARK